VRARASGLSLSNERDLIPEHLWAKGFECSAACARWKAGYLLTDLGPRLDKISKLGLLHPFHGLVYLFNGHWCVRLCVVCVLKSQACCMQRCLVLLVQFTEATA
jgi:hypothetical protein